MAIIKNLKSEHQYTSIRALQVYALYRIVVSSFLLTFFLLKAGDIFLGQKNPVLYYWSALLYFVSSVGFYFINRIYQQAFRFLVEIQVFVEITLLTLLMHSSGGVATGLGMLMAVSATTACLLVERGSSLAFAAIAATAVLTEAFYLSITGQTKSDYITQAGLLGATYFATSLFALLTARRLKQSELEAELTSADLANMERLNETIIQFMKTGVIVIDKQRRIQFINTAAWELLEMPSNIQGKPLSGLSEELDNAIENWDNSKQSINNFRQSQTGPKINIKISRIDERNQFTLLFLEDTTPMTQQAQNLKLASLGRLTASIAHEIRNPLGALSHAAQLLEESTDINEADKKLVEMIQKNSVRVNAIIENVMQLSQRQKSEAQDVRLKSFLSTLSDELKRSQSDNVEIIIDITPNELIIQFDISQLQQVITNLAENGLRYSKENTGASRITFFGGVNSKTQQAFLDIIDDGPGIHSDMVQNIFEPFFTTSPTGTGLGLYISKELCEANRAQLDYIPVPNGGACFRITFAREDES
ncbi:two-component system sensor histidine kinase NtrB [Pleionea sediminis]|uniref:two-component system sensor histidine kinase NtrB n=1 Tax=Pleionea sediminis TaxID=2569479 RepID=UPI001185AAFB|nr:ATP-binding protein [Pleionea sediminis]